jgi:hypothetical protein
MNMRNIASKSTLLQRVRRLFAERWTKTTAAPSTPRLRPEPRGDASIAGARFSLVGLAELREQLGDRWPQLSARVHDLAQAVIQRHLSRGDVFDAHGEDSYVILFTELSQLQAQFKCRVIAKEIAAKLLGADWTGRATEGLVFELPETALSAPSFDKALNEAIAKGRLVTSEEVPAPASTCPFAFGPSGEPPAVARPASHALKPIARDRDVAGYAPVWDFGVEALLHFRFNPSRLSMGAGSSALDDAKTDLAALNQVLFDVSRLLQSGRRLPVICPVRLETLLRDGWCAQIARMLRSAPIPLRKLVTLEVAVAADGNADWLGSLEKAWRSLPGRPVACLSLAGPVAPPISSSLIGHLNLALPVGFSATKTDIEALGAFVQRAERVRMTCGVLGLRTRAAALAATAAGFSQLSGPAVHPDVASLSQAVRFDLKTLYRDLLPAAV